MREHDFDAIRKAREVNFQARMLEGQMLESFFACCNDSRLQSIDGSDFEARGIGKMVRDTSNRGR